MAGLCLSSAFSLSTREAEAGDFYKFKVSMVYRVSSRTARATQRQKTKTNKQLKNNWYRYGWGKKSITGLSFLI